jgi:hypothetical protein
MKTPLDEDLIPILSKYLYSQICLSKMKTPQDEDLIPILSKYLYLFVKLQIWSYIIDL